MRGFNWASTQTGNKDGLLDIDFGLKEWNELAPKEIVRKYRQFVYETGAVDAGKGKTIEKKVVEKARKKGYKISRVERFRYRCRYFTDSGAYSTQSGQSVHGMMDSIPH